jgi:hypothetical protein
MPAMKDQYSVNEAKKPEKNRVYHNNSGCGPFKEIPVNERRDGRNGYRLCDDCEVINKDEAKK